VQLNDPRIRESASVPRGHATDVSQLAGIREWTGESKGKAARIAFLDRNIVEG